MRRSLGSAARLRLFAILTAIAALAAFGLASSALAGTGAQLTISPTSKNFGSVIAGSSSGAFTFTVKNIGTVQATGNLTISLGGANAADFTKAPGSTGTPCVNGGTPLAAGSSCTIDVTFSPQPSASGEQEREPEGLGDTGRRAVRRAVRHGARRRALDHPDELELRQLSCRHARRP